MAPTLEVAFSLIESQLKAEKIIAVYESLVYPSKVQTKSIKDKVSPQGLKLAQTISNLLQKDIVVLKVLYQILRFK